LLRGRKSTIKSEPTRELPLQLKLLKTKQEARQFLSTTDRSSSKLPPKLQELLLRRKFRELVTERLPPE